MNDAAQRRPEQQGFTDAAGDLIAQAAALMNDGHAIYRRVRAEPGAERTARELAVHGIRLSQLIAAAETLAATAFCLGAEPPQQPAAPASGARHRAPRTRWLSPVQGWIAAPAAAAAVRHAGHAHKAAVLAGAVRRITRTHRVLATGAAAMTAGLATAGTMAMSVTNTPFAVQAARPAVPAVVATVQAAPPAVSPQRHAGGAHRRHHGPAGAPVRVSAAPRSTPPASPSPSGTAPDTAGRLAVSPAVIPAASTVQVTLTASGGPARWTATAPSGILLSAYSGTVVPGQPGTVVITVTGAAAVLSVQPGPDRGTWLITVTRA